MSATPGVYKTQFDSLFRYKKGSLIPISFLEKELYLEGQYKSHSDLERYLRHSNIINNPSFLEKDGILQLKDYEYIGSNHFSKTAIISHIPTTIFSNQKSREVYSNIEEKEKDRKSKKKSKKYYDYDSDEDRKTTKSSVLSFVTQSDLDTIRRDINGMQSEFQTHGDKMYSTVKKQEEYLRRMEGVCNSQDHLEWLENLSFDELPPSVRKSLLKKLLHSNLNDTLKDMSDIMTEEDGRKHNLLLSADGMKSGSGIELENRSVWTNSNRGEYSFQLHDQTSFLGFGSSRIVSDKTKFDHHLTNHFRK